jgi:hypothetical protein
MRFVWLVGSEPGAAPAGWSVRIWPWTFAVYGARVRAPPAPTRAALARFISDLRLQ